MVSSSSSAKAEDPRLRHYPPRRRGQPAFAAKDAALSLAGNMAAIMHTVAPDEVVKNSFANDALEHFEIASYKSLLVLAEAVGRGSDQSALKQSLGEELDMARWIDAHLADTTVRFLQRSASSMKAGL